MDHSAIIEDICGKARQASLALATLSNDDKSKALARLAVLIRENEAPLVEANKKDLAAGKASGLNSALLDRLELTPARINGMIKGIEQVIALPDPVGEEIERLENPRGLDIRKVRVPIGVIGIIYESRPNVTVDCAILCFKSGNASILRGGKEAFHSNLALAKLIDQAFSEAGMPANCVQLIPTTDRAAMNALLKQDATVSCIIPRGGEGLIRFVAENSTIPVIKHYKGVCSLYFDAEQDDELALKVGIDAKCQRPSVCNAAENFYIHRSIAEHFLPKMAAALKERGVELRCDEEAAAICSQHGIETIPVKEEDWSEEYIDLILAIGIVDSKEEAGSRINTYGSAHSDCVITTDADSAEYFLNNVDSSTVYWNASTRFTDGFEFGLGAEIGISTDKLHARGVMGLKELCTYKYKVYGKGETKA